MGFLRILWDIYYCGVETLVLNSTLRSSGFRGFGIDLGNAQVVIYSFFIACPLNPPLKKRPNKSLVFLFWPDIF